jgi:hypothetical protein
LLLTRQYNNILLDSELLQFLIIVLVQCVAMTREDDDLDPIPL